MPVVKPDYVAPSWCVGEHMQTIIPAKLSPRDKVDYRRERWNTPDGDFIDVDWVTPEVEDERAPVLVHFHGLEGSSRSHYAQMLMAATARRHWRGCVAHFRGCSGENNRLPRAYHAGDTAEVKWVLQTVKNRYPYAPLYVVGVSLGGNQVSRYLGEAGVAARRLVKAAVSVGAPVDLVAGSNLMRIGFNRLYGEMFISTLKDKVAEKVKRFPEELSWVDLKAIKKCRTLYQFDELYTAPVHGFASAIEYWTLASAKPVLKNVQVPLLLLNAKNDPFLPDWALPTEQEVSDFVTLDFPDEGGHIGFPRGKFPGDISYLPERIMRYFDSIL